MERGEGMKDKIYPIYYFEWRDHFASNSGWTDIEKIEKDIPSEFMCKAVGFLIKEEKNFITIAQILNDRNECAELMNILRESITKKRRIRL